MRTARRAALDRSAPLRYMPAPRTFPRRRETPTEAAMAVDVNTLPAEEAVKLEDDELFDAWCVAKKNALLKPFSGPDRLAKRRWANDVVRAVRKKRQRFYAGEGEY
jgi:hypothetical protein